MDYLWLDTPPYSAAQVKVRVAKLLQMETAPECKSEEWGCAYWTMHTGDADKKAKGKGKGAAKKVVEGDAVVIEMAVDLAEMKQRKAAIEGTIKELQEKLRKELEARYAGVMSGTEKIVGEGWEIEWVKVPQPEKTVKAYEQSYPKVKKQ